MKIRQKALFAGIILLAATITIAPTVALGEKNSHANAGSSDNHSQPSVSVHRENGNSSNADNGHGFIRATVNTSIDTHSSASTPQSVSSGNSIDSTQKTEIASPSGNGNSNGSNQQEGGNSGEHRGSLAITISGVTANNLASSSANIAWMTNRPATSDVWVGTTSSIDTSLAPTASDAQHVTLHNLAITGLSPGTTYYYTVGSQSSASNDYGDNEGGAQIRMMARSENGMAASVNGMENENESYGGQGANGGMVFAGPFSFTTPGSGPDVTPPVISALATSNISNTTATVSWQTNENANGTVWYSTTSPVNTGTASSSVSALLVQDHSMTLTGLTPSTTYYALVTSADASGNLATSSQFSFATTATPDVTPPVISSAGSAAVTASSAHIVWTTNELANSTVWYDTATPVNITASSTPMISSGTLVINHDVALSGLSASTTYYYVIASTDPSGNVATTTQASFTTPAM